MNNRAVGQAYEDRARAYLESQGVKILEQNFRNRKGEVDLIGRHGEYLVFFEVKYRKHADNGNPLEAVTYAKQRQICAVADFYRMSRKYSEFTPIRFDVVGILDTEISWIKNAFPYISYYR